MPSGRTPPELSPHPGVGGGFFVVVGGSLLDGGVDGVVVVVGRGVVVDVGFGWWLGGLGRFVVVRSVVGSDGRVSVGEVVVGDVVVVGGVVVVVGGWWPGGTGQHQSQSQRGGWNVTVVDACASPSVPVTVMLSRTGCRWYTRTSNRNDSLGANGRSVVQLSAPLCPLHVTPGSADQGVDGRSTVTVTGFVLVPTLVAVMSSTGEPFHSQLHHESHLSRCALSARLSTTGGGGTRTRTVRSTDIAVPEVTVPVMSPSCASVSAVSRKTITTVSPGWRPSGDVQIAPEQVTVPLDGAARGAIGRASNAWPPSPAAEPDAVTPGGSRSVVVTGPDGPSPVLVTVTGSSTLRPGVRVSPSVGPDAVNVGCPGGGGVVVVVVVGAGGGGAGDPGAAGGGAGAFAAGGGGGAVGRVVGGGVVVDGAGDVGGGGVRGAPGGGTGDGADVAGGGTAAAAGMDWVLWPVNASASTAANAATDTPTPTNCRGSEPAAPAAPDAAPALAVVPAAATATPATVLPVAAR